MSNLIVRTIGLTRGAVDVELRSIPAVLATPGRVAVQLPGTRQIVEEILSMSGWRATTRAPLWDSHFPKTSVDVLGTVRGIRREGAKIVGDLFFSSGERSEEVWNKVQDGAITDVSVGYERHAVTVIPPRRSATVAGVYYTANDLPLHITTAWSIRHVAIAAQGADRKAKIGHHSAPSGIRSQPTMPAIHSRPPTITREAIAAGLQMRLGQMLDQRQAERGHEFCDRPLPEIARACLDLDGRPSSGGNWPTIVKDACEFSRSFADVLQSGMGSQLLAAHDASKDTTEGICRVAEGVRDFKKQERFAPSVLPTLDRLPRGTAAVEAAPDFTAAEEYRIARFAKQMNVSAEDIADDHVDAIGAVFAAIGREAATLRPNLVWALILANGALADGTALFDAGTRGNLGTGAFSQANLQVATAAMRAFTMNDESARAHVLNVQPVYLIVPGDLGESAKAVLNSLQLGQGDDLILRVDARLGTGGVINPVDDQRVVGTATNWFLFASPTDSPVIEIAFRDGRREPMITQTPLTNGRWGFNYSVNLDIGAKAIGWRGAYASSGTV